MWFFKRHTHEFITCVGGFYADEVGGPKTYHERWQECVLCDAVIGKDARERSEEITEKGIEVIVPQKKYTRDDLWQLVHNYQVTESREHAFRIARVLAQLTAGSAYVVGFPEPHYCRWGIYNEEPSLRGVDWSVTRVRDDGIEQVIE